MPLSILGDGMCLLCPRMPPLGAQGALGDLVRSLIAI